MFLSGQTQEIIPFENFYLCPLHTEIAVSPNNNVVNIYEKKDKEWVKIHELNEHSGRITGTYTHFHFSLEKNLNM